MCGILFVYNLDDAMTPDCCCTDGGDGAIHILFDDVRRFLRLSGAMIYMSSRAVGFHKFDIPRSLGTTRS